jgi:hypothetical protein
LTKAKRITLVFVEMEVNPRKIEWRLNRVQGLRYFRGDCFFFSSVLEIIYFLFLKFIFNINKLKRLYVKIIY